MERTPKTLGLRAGIAVGAAIALLGIVFGVTVASIPASGGTISACYKITSGALRVIDYPSHHCVSGERMLRWNQSSGPAPLSALVGMPCSGVGAGGTLYLDVTPETGVVTLTCKTLLKVQSAVKLSLIVLTVGPPGQAQVTRQCENATSCSLTVPFGSTSAQITMNGPTDFSYTCPGSTLSTGVPDATRTNFFGTCPALTMNADRTLVVTKF
jgi:hypothetical protein